MDQTNDPALVRIREGNPKLVVRLLPKWDATEPPPYRAAAP